MMCSTFCSRTIRMFTRAVLATAAVAALLAAQRAESSRGARRAPDLADVSYGPHERHVLDFWRAESHAPAPLVIYIHGGGFRNGSKESIHAGTLSDLLDAGIHVAAINYRFVQHSPLPAAHHDSRRALQFLRSKAAAWNIDKTRIGAFGGSAGAQICMWLAFHDDMAEADRKDRLARESTRLSAVATNGGQTTMDLAWWKKWIPRYSEPHRSWLETFGTDDPAKMSEIIRDIAALDLASADDPPIFMSYGMAPDDPVPADPRRATGWKVHHVVFGIKLKEKLDQLGVEAHLKHPGAESKYPSVGAFFKAKLGGR